METFTTKINNKSNGINSIIIKPMRMLSRVYPHKGQEN